MPASQVTTPSKGLLLLAASSILRLKHGWAAYTSCWSCRLDISPRSAVWSSQRPCPGLSAVIEVSQFLLLIFVYGLCKVNLEGQGP